MAYMKGFPEHFDFTIRMKVKWSMNKDGNVVGNMEYDTEKTKKFLEELGSLCEKYGINTDCKCEILK